MNTTTTHGTTPITNNLLRVNPFTTYRDPQTGKWLVVRPNNKYQG